MENKEIQPYPRDRGGKDKRELHGWTMKDRPGMLMDIPKADLHIPAEYQRRLVVERVLDFARAWSWLQCGVLTVALRPDDGKLYVVDGQHRVTAAARRSDIKTLPCIVFELDSIEQEARGFLDVNTLRKGLTASQRWNALFTAKDESAQYIASLLDAYGLVVANGPRGQGIRCISALVEMDRLDRPALTRVWPLIVEVCSGHPITNPFVRSFVWIERNMAEGSLSDPRWRRRVLALGHDGLLKVMSSAAAFYGLASAKTWGQGIVSALNKGLRTTAMTLKADK